MAKNVKTKAKAKKSPTKAGKTDLIVSSKIRALIKTKRNMTSSEFLPALNQFIKQTVEAACARAKANKRTTLRAQDL